MQIMDLICILFERPMSKYSFGTNIKYISWQIPEIRQVEYVYSQVFVNVMKLICIICKLDGIFIKLRDTKLKGTLSW